MSKEPADGPREGWYRLDRDRLVFLQFSEEEPEDGADGYMDYTLVDPSPKNATIDGGLIGYREGMSAYEILHGEFGTKTSVFMTEDAEGTIRTAFEIGAWNYLETVFEELPEMRIPLSALEVACPPKPRALFEANGLGGYYPGARPDLYVFK